MQVKKFEAKTIKDALQLVKQELGPEAIILGAKDNKKSFGIAGNGSVEVTAAISEKALQKKIFTESRLPSESVTRFRSASAKNQKSLIEETILKYQERNSGSGQGRSPKAEKVTRPATSRRYIDIDDSDEANGDSKLRGRSVKDILDDFLKNDNYVLEDAANGAKPISTAAKAKAQAQAAKPMAPVLGAGSRNMPDFSSEVTQARAHGLPNTEVLSLKQEVDTLRTMLQQLQSNPVKVPMTQHPGAEFGLPFELSRNFEKLQTGGVETKYIVEILEKADKELTQMEKKKPSLVDGWVARYLLSHTSVVGEWSKFATSGPQIHVFVGPGGNGKTTTIVKLASHMAFQEKKRVAIFSADTFKVGAAEQLKIYSQIMNMPFETVKHSVEYANLIKKYQDYDVVVIDTPGFSLKDIGEIDQIRTLLPQRATNISTHLVMSCGLKENDAYEICHRYQVTHFDDLLVTKLDEASNHGFLFNIQRRTEKPLYAFGVGQRIPEDMELASRERVLDLIYKISKK